MNGKLIVIEGSDGSGKATQLKLLKEYLESKNVSVNTIDFPRYQESFYGDIIARFMRGEFGELKNIDPYLISVMYALDRAQAKDEMEEWLSKGSIVLSNRYATSNLAHQAGRLPKEKKQEFVDWALKLEYTINKIPKEDIVIFLYVPYKVAKNLLANADRAKRSYTKGEKRDIVEQNEEYLLQAEKTYLWLVSQFPHWIQVNCVTENGELRTREDINLEIREILKEKGVISV